MLERRVQMMTATMRTCNISLLRKCTLHICHRARMRTAHGQKLTHPSACVLCVLILQTRVHDARQSFRYVWAREGGSARPMPVQWGDLGATSSAAHLEHTEYSVQTGDHSAGANAERLSNCETDYETADSTSCCDECISTASINARSMWIVACDAYARIANLRPLRN